MRAFFYARVREARKKTGLGNFEFFGIFGNCGGRWSGLGLSGSEFERERKIFGIFGKFGVKTKFFEFFGKFEFFGFQKGWRSHYILFEM